MLDDQPTTTSDATATPDAPPPPASAATPATAPEQWPVPALSPVRGNRLPRISFDRSLHPLVTHLGAVTLGVVATIAIVLGAGGVGRSTTDGASIDGSLTATEGYAVTGASVGVPDAPLTIEIWADYQCPYCGLFTHGVEPTILREYAATGRAIVRFRDYAFLGEESITAAVAARCADREGAYWRFHDLLYASQSGENQGAFVPANLVRLAEFAGLDTAAFSACLAEPGMAAEVAAETREGALVGVDSTPTVRIIGEAGVRTLKGLAPLQTLTAAIDAVERGDVDSTDGSAGTDTLPGSSSSSSAPAESPAP